MKTILLLLLLIVGLVPLARAQKGDNQLQLLLEVGFPEKGYNVGRGGYLKYLYGVGKSGQLTLSTGLSVFSFYPDLAGREAERSYLRTIPILLGYKHNLKGFYVEPQAGFGELGGRVDIGGDWAHHSVGAFYWGLGTGYGFKRLDVGVRLQSAHGAEKEGGWSNKTFRFFGVRAGFALWQKKDPA